MKKQISTQIVAQSPRYTIQTAAPLLTNLCSRMLVATVWISAGLFGLYILAFYVAALWNGNLEKWNTMLRGLYHKQSPVATAGISLHFATGAIILLLGSIQMMDKIRIRFPGFHRWVGKVYLVCCLMAAIGGLSFIVTKGTIGGVVMDIGFALYGVLMCLAVILTYRYAVTGFRDLHRAWAFRLYALAIGSWLYRMDYGFWIMITDGIGHLTDFNGVFDKVMAFFFYIPNLVVAEIMIRHRARKTSVFFSIISSAVLLFLTGFLLIGTYYFTKLFWGPAIIGLFS